AYDIYMCLVGSEMCIRDRGTTRDAIDTIFEKDGQKYTIVDTAGIRRKGKVYEKVEKYSVMRSISAIEQSDVAIIVIDASVGIIEQDKHIAGYAHDAGKGVIIAVNKWDVPYKTTTSMQDFVKVIRQEFQYLDYAPIVFVSAKTGQRIEDIVSLVKNVKENQQRRIQSSVLNDLLLDATRITPTPLVNGKRLRIYYMTQVAVVPPTFVVFVNDPELLHFSYKRFLINQMRQNFNFEGTPIKILARKRK
ncbi:GTP-binding protein, partial [Lactobacillus iners]|uniref:GTP-binding protein n=1 Tax=Lactobacillus iners TaxID=147802 RepID=UPI001F08E3BE